MLTICPFDTNQNPIHIATGGTTYCIHCDERTHYHMQRTAHGYQFICQECNKPVDSNKFDKELSC